MTPKEIFAAMPGQLDQNAAKGVNATIQFNLSGDNGGQWYVAIKDGTAQVSEGTAPSANMTMSMAANDYVDMTTGKLNGQMAFMTGKIKVGGNMAKIMMHQNVLNDYARVLSGLDIDY